MSSAVQRLYETCKEVFASGGAGFVPSPNDAERLSSVLDSMEPSDVGLDEEMLYFRKIKAERNPLITYLHLYECNKFSIGIFCLPPSGVIPLHNHPGMTVFSKLLYGSMHIKSYDWVTDVSDIRNVNLNLSYFRPTGIHLAKVENNSIYRAPCKTSILYPAAGGNIHCFSALTSCAVLDVLGPPYSDAEGRPCTYYRDFPYSSFAGNADSVSEDVREGYAWLEKREKPKDFVAVGAVYRGPIIMES